MSEHREATQKENEPQRRRSVAIVTLGCGRNEADSDNVGGLLQSAGFDVTDDPDTADAVVVNTCTFIAAAREESVETVLDATDGDRPVIVMGCMAERYGAELHDAVPEASAVVGFDRYAEMNQIVTDALQRKKGADAVTDRVHPGASSGDHHIRGLPIFTGTLPNRPAPSAPPTASFPVRTVPRGPWAYLKIAGGCDRICTFCSIPSFRGRFESRPLDELRAEVEWLVSEGVRELICVSENTTSWGKDLPGRRRNQPDLVAMFDEVEGLERARLMYLQPAELTDQLLDAMAASSTVCSYYDLSLQHASASVLKAMARSGSSERFLQLIEGIRRRDPDAVFRSSFITGFPGETDDDVETLKQFIAEAGIDWAGVFTFSPEDGTVAAELPDRPSEAEARRRAAAISEVIDLVGEDQASQFIGRTIEVMVDANTDTGSVGRSYREAPETDGEIVLPAVGTPPGRIVTAEVTGTDGVDLIVKPIRSGGIADGPGHASCRTR